MIKKVIAKFKEALFGPTVSSKVRENIVYSQPAYLNRHKGRDFLVIGTGPSLNVYGDRIKELIRLKNLIVIGVNHITPFIHPAYHAITNRRRFMQYASTIDPKQSHALLSLHFPDALIKRLYNGPYDLVSWRKDVDIGVCDIDSEGVISMKATSALVQVMVAYVMGARTVYVAGVDGYSKYFNSGGVTHYREIKYRRQGADDHDEWLQQQQSDQIVNLTQMKIWAERNERNVLKFITPGEHMDYFDPTVLNINLGELE